MRRRIFAACIVLLHAPPALATPGPDSVVVVANANVPESVALAARYAAARDVPANRVCALDLPDQEDITLDEYRTRLLEPLRACLDAGAIRERIEAAVIIRGVPLRVSVPVADGSEIVSTAAALGLWESALSDGRALLGEAPGTRTTCGGGVSCYAARWRNPFRGAPFDAGWSSEASGVVWRPLLVTMLTARSYEDAARLIESAIRAEAEPARGELLFMDGADPARGAQDTQNATVIPELEARGFTATSAPFDANLTGRTLAAFFTGTASIGETIEGNTFQPGALVDNLTSFGAHPVNFRASGENQVSIARWVAMGAAGVHGTVEEPLNNCFPHRGLAIDYVDGATLAEAYHSKMPYVYWRNLVLGDPMAAPYALRPVVSVTGVSDGATLTGAVRVGVRATDPNALGIESIVLYLDGVEIARTGGEALDHCLFVGTGDDHQLLAVARGADDPSGARPFRSKGWVALALDGAGGSAECVAPAEDAGLPDAGVLDASQADAGVAPPSGGCGCRASGTTRGSLACLVLAPLLARSRRARARRANGAEHR